VPEELFWLTYLVSPPVQTATHYIRLLARLPVPCPRQVCRVPSNAQAASRQGNRHSAPQCGQPHHASDMEQGAHQVPQRPGRRLSDLYPHFEFCPGRVDAVAVAEVRRELALEREPAEMRERKFQETIEELQTYLEILQAESEELQTEFKRRTAFDATYSYGRERIVELAQVIDYAGPRELPTGDQPKQNL
jgi:hypothetical protein